MIATAAADQTGANPAFVLEYLSGLVTARSVHLYPPGIIFMLDARRTSNLWHARMLFFFMYAGIGIYFLFLNIYYRGIGLSGTQIGLVATLGPLAGILSSTLWGYLNDRFGKPRLLFAFSIPGVMLCVAGLAFARSFGAILVLAVVYGLFNGPISPLIDSVTLHLLGEKKTNYGMIRLWGTVGYVIASGAAGFLLAKLGYNMMFIGYLIALLGMLVTAHFLPNRPIPPRQSLSAGLKLLVRKPQWLLFMGCVFLVSMSLMAMLNFSGVMVKDMGGSESLIGLSWAIPAIIEVPLMYLGARLIKRFKAANFLLISMFGYGVQLFFLAIMPRPEWLLWNNLLTKPITYVPYWLGAVAYANEVAPEELKSTSQGLLSSMLGFASLSGALVSGWMFDQIGPGKMFLVFAGVCVLDAVIFTLGRWVLQRRVVSTLTQ
jgi:PPP family 3-phenylpropionic acid transporter